MLLRVLALTQQPNKTIVNNPFAFKEGGQEHENDREEERRDNFLQDITDRENNSSSKCER